MALFRGNGAPAGNQVGEKTEFYKQRDFLLFTAGRKRQFYGSPYGEVGENRRSAL